MKYRIPLISRICKFSDMEIFEQKWLKRIFIVFSLSRCFSSQDYILKYILYLKKAFSKAHTPKSCDTISKKDNGKVSENQVVVKCRRLSYYLSTVLTFLLTYLLAVLLNVPFFLGELGWIYGISRNIKILCLVTVLKV